MSHEKGTNGNEDAGAGGWEGPGQGIQNQSTAPEPYSKYLIIAVNLSFSTFKPKLEAPN